MTSKCAVQRQAAHGDKGTETLKRELAEERVSVENYRVDDGQAFALGACATSVMDHYKSRSDYQRRLDTYRRSIRQWQRKLFADGRHGLLIVVQGMDAAGKNGLIRRVVGGVDPAGLHVWSFGPPSAPELRQDFMRRYHRYLPDYGEIAVFNRSYYEFALSARIHPEWLEAHGIDPKRAEQADFWEQVFQSIRDFETYLTNNGIHLVKLMPHVSAAVQRERLLDRLHKENKRWKLTEADCDDAMRWSAFAKVYEASIQATATPATPWYVLPGDDKRTTRLLAAEAVLQKLESIAPDWPQGIHGANAKERERIAQRLDGGDSPA